MTAATSVSGGDGFTVATERHRRELHVHCYRMLASFEEAEDAVQETMLRAWRGRDSFDGTQPRAWLYRIATNVCLDALRRNARQANAAQSHVDVPWLQPYPDRLLDELVPSEEQPDSIVVDRETIGLAFLAAMQVLPPRQRAVFILRDVLGWPAAQTAGQLEMSVAAANSAVQRARLTMQQHLPARRADWSEPELTEGDRSLLAAFIDAHERGDVPAMVAAAAPNLRITMPPYPIRYDGLDVIRPILENAFGPARDGDWRLLPVAANRMPTAASYLRRPGDTEFRAFKFDVLRIVDGKIAEITTFGPQMFPAFDLSPTLA